MREAVFGVFHRQYVMKPEDVPESHFEFRKRVARERGHGNIELTPEMRREIVDTIIADQKRSLDTWISYMLSPDTFMYPMWVKYWMVTGVAKLSRFNAQDGTFGHRSKETVAPFPELNREALAYVVDAIVKHVEGKDLSSIQDPKLIDLLPGSHFGKMYAHALVKAGTGKGQRFFTNEGRWVVYKRGSDPIPLVKSLEGQNTGWCTAGEQTARDQLARGDFYVYYSFDSKGLPSVPRVAIRMEGEKIAEVRGVGPEQNLDAQISSSEVVRKKLEEFGSEGERYFKKEAHMKKLSSIERKMKLNQELTKEELVFLYEINERIEGFGQERDPRIEELKALRDLKSDLFTIYEGKYRKEEISLTAEEALSGRAKLHYGNLDLSHIRSAEGLILPEKILGNLDLGGLKSAEGLKLPEKVGGLLNLGDLKSAEGLRLPKEIGGGLVLFSLRSAEGLEFPAKIGGSLDLGGLTSAKGLQLPKEIGGNLDLGALVSASDLKLPGRVGGHVNLRRLTSAQGLEWPKQLGAGIELQSLRSLKGVQLPAPERIAGRIHVLRLDHRDVSQLKEKGYQVLDY